MLGKHELKWRVARYLREGRKAKGLTLCDVSQLTKMSVSHLSRLERADSKRVDLYEVMLLASLFEIGLDEICATA
jgi:transcriptional regulator with XRE-family HTH domain